MPSGVRRLVVRMSTDTVIILISMLRVRSSETILWLTLRRLHVHLRRPVITASACALEVRRTIKGERNLIEARISREMQFGSQVQTSISDHIHVNSFEANLLYFNFNSPSMIRDKLVLPAKITYSQAYDCYPSSITCIYPIAP